MLKVLPQNIANLIAAGEVVQRPGSVVKELMENSIDAGADNLNIIIDDSGRTLIQVIDNGCGMNEDDAKLCFERHATSKISKAKDLDSILTYGFRGEALASIAAVAEVTLKTRKENTEIGSTTHFAESNFLGQSPCSIPVGTNISIRNLFFNIPARRKFLKSDNSEFRQIVNEFSRIAISHPNIEFNLIHNSKDILKLPKTESLKKRIIDILGKTMSKQLVEACTSNNIVNISGFTGSPEEARKSLGNQYLFVNNRFFRSAYLHKAIMKAYENLIPEGYTPSYFLFLEIAPSEVDVNISPTKTEVKFENESQIFEIVNATIREALGKNAFTPSIDFDVEGTPEIPIALKGQYVPPPKIDFDPLFNPFIDNYTLGPNYVETQIPRSYENEEDGTYGEIFESKNKCSNNIIQVQGKYLITTIKSGLLAVNISRARQRILYEKFLQCLDDSNPIVQMTMFPKYVELDHNSYSILMEQPGRIKLLGFDIEADIENENTVIVKGMPDGYPDDSDSAVQCIYDLVSILEENSSDAMIKAQSRHEIALRLANSAIKSSTEQLSSFEAHQIIDMLFASKEPDKSPLGLATTKIIDMDQIDKLF